MWGLSDIKEVPRAVYLIGALSLAFNGAVGYLMLAQRRMYNDFQKTKTRLERLYSEEERLLGEKVELQRRIQGLRRLMRSQQIPERSEEERQRQRELWRQVPIQMIMKSGC